MTTAEIGLRLLMIENMPMYFNALVVESTSVCTARCAMCYQSAGPKGSDKLGKASLMVEEVKRVVRDAACIETLHPRFHLTGGEAFLDTEACIELFQVARESGFVDLSTTTNAFWARKPERAYEICRRLREAGVTTMEVSWDWWHMPYVPAEAISNCLDACWHVGIESNLRLLSSRTHTAEEALRPLRPDSVDRSSRISCGPVFPTGRAAVELDRADLYPQGTLDDACHSYLNLTVNAWGDVYPCCAGIDQTNEYVFGNIRKQSIDQIAAAMNRSSMLRTIVFGGITALVPILQQAGIDIGTQYNSICHMCWSIFSRPDCVRAIRDYFSELQRQAILRAVTGLEAGRQHAS